MLEVASYFGGKAVDMLPRLVTRRLFPPDKVAQDMKIELLSDKDTITRDLRAQVPFLHLDFRITNFSPLRAVLDRLLLNIWFGQPTLDGAILERYLIPPRKPGQNVTFRHALTSDQKQQVEQFYGNQLGGQLHIYYKAYFETKIGLIEVKNTITQNRP